MVEVDPALFHAHFGGATKSAWLNYQNIVPLIARSLSNPVHMKAMLIPL